LEAHFSRIKSMEKYLYRINYYHILHEKNQEEDDIDKATKFLDQSHQVVNHQPSYVLLP
jgi:hypothetical protein